MDHAHSKLLTAFALVVVAGVLSVAACTHTTDRVVEPVGGADASTTSPEAADASVGPIGPIASPIEPAEDFRLVRAPEFGIAQKVDFISSSERERSRASRSVDMQGPGGYDAGGNAGFAGSDLRPVASGGNYY